MKHRSKLVCILLAMILVLAMSVPAFADGGTNTITVTGAQKGETYSIYKMLDLSVSADKKAYIYMLNTDWEDFFTGEAGKDYVTCDTVNGKTYVTWNDNKKETSDMEAFAKAAASYAASKSAVTTDTPETGGSIIFEGLDSGYYLITSTKGTLAMVQTTPQNPDATINEKNPNPEISKQVQEDKDASWGTSNTAQIGDTVNFKLTIQVKKGAKNYVVHDQMQAGLTLNANSVSVEGLTKGSDNDFTVKTDNLTDGCTFEIHFTDTYLNSITENKTLTVNYNAVLNANAASLTGVINKAKITWGDNSKTDWSETTTNTYKFSILKYDGTNYEEGDEKNPLAGATFKLNNNGVVVKLVPVGEDGITYRVANGDEQNSVEQFTTGSTGEITIIGVDLEDNYTLTEISAPPGFQLIKKPIGVKVNADNKLLIDVANYSGTVLPSTGGIGTTVFYVVGAALVLGAVVILITRKRMGAK